MERGEYNHLQDNSANSVSSVNDAAPGSSMLSFQLLISSVKRKVGVMYHNKVEQMFEFLKSHPLILMWTDFGEEIVNGTHLPGTNVYEMLDYLFHDWRKVSKQSPLKGLDKLIPVLFQMVLIYRMLSIGDLKVFSHANESCKRPSLVKKKQRDIRSQGIKWSVY